MPNSPCYSITITQHCTWINNTLGPCNVHTDWQAEWYIVWHPRLQQSSSYCWHKGLLPSCSCTVKIAPWRVLAGIGMNADQTHLCWYTHSHSLQQKESFGIYLTCPPHPTQYPWAPETLQSSTEELSHKNNACTDHNTLCNTHTWHVSVKRNHIISSVEIRYSHSWKMGNTKVTLYSRVQERWAGMLFRTELVTGNYNNN